MAHDSPMDFYSSSAKKKTPPGKGPLLPPKQKSLSRSTVDVKKIKPALDDPEISAALSRVKILNDELKTKIEQAAEKTGKSTEEMKAIIASSSALSAKDKEFLKQTEKEFSEKLAGITKGSPASAAKDSGAKSDNNPTGGLRSKSKSAKRKWMPMG